MQNLMSSSEASEVSISWNEGRLAASLRRHDLRILAMGDGVQGGGSSLGEKFKSATSSSTCANSESELAASTSLTRVTASTSLN